MRRSRGIHRILRVGRTAAAARTTSRAPAVTGCSTASPSTEAASELVGLDRGGGVATSVPFLRSLLLLLALVSPALSQDGPHDASTAQNAAQAFGLYLDGALKSGKQPNFTKPPASDLFRYIFDV